jgi:hypothetical protein
MHVLLSIYFNFIVQYIESHHVPVSSPHSSLKSLFFKLFFIALLDSTDMYHIPILLLPINYEGRSRQMGTLDGL